MTVTVDNVTGSKWVLYPLDDKGVKDGNFLPILVLETSVKWADLDSYLGPMTFETWDINSPAFAGANDWNTRVFISTADYFKIYVSNNRIFIKNCVTNGSIQFDAYGTSETISTMTICGSKFYGEPIHGYTYNPPYSTVDNIEIIEWGNTKTIN